MKKLIPAICLLLISAMMLGTSTFAWFSMNTTVTATGMQVTAKVPDSLQISITSATTNFGATVALTNETTAAWKSTLGVSPEDAMVIPTRYVANTTDTYAAPVFYKLTDAAMQSVNEAGALTGAHATAQVADNDTYDVTTAEYFVDQMWLRFDGAAGTTKKVTVKVEWAAALPNTDTISGAVHVLFLDAKGKELLDWDMTDSGAYQSDVTAKDLGTMTLTAGATEGTAVYAYAYLAGTDAQCYNKAISANDLFQLTITYGVADVSGS